MNHLWLHGVVPMVLFCKMPMTNLITGINMIVPTTGNNSGGWPMSTVLERENITKKDDMNHRGVVK